MNKRLMNLVVMVALAATICLPGMASGRLCRKLVENGLYGTPANYQTWDKPKPFCFPPAPGPEPV